MGTIVQDYGPIYGEAVNGTVQGRPNGSVYVPSSNVVTIQLDDDYKFMKYVGSIIQFTDSAGVVPGVGPAVFVATAQDLASNILVNVYSDSDLTSLVCTRSGVAGQFNMRFGGFTSPAPGLTAGDPLYMVAYLMNNGTAVATSTTVIMEMVS